jgi:peptidyl-prolyl cis-trans isomerase B (cyclophilin B)
VFGEVVEGIDLIDKIAAEAIDVYEWPKKDIPIKMTVLK